VECSAIVLGMMMFLPERIMKQWPDWTRKESRRCVMQE
jgi:hypothetical protein